MYRVLEKCRTVLFFNNSAKIKPMKLKFGLFIERVGRFFLKKKLLNLVKGLSGNGFAKATPDFLRRRHGHGPHEDIPQGPTLRALSRLKLNHFS